MKKKTYAILVIPCFLILLITLIYPLFTLIFPTFFSDSGFLANYVVLFKDDLFRTVLFRTVKIGLIVTTVCILLGVPSSYYISRCDKKVRGTLMALSLFPLLTNSVIRAFAWITILGKNGIINNLLIALGITSEPISILYSEFSIIIGTIYLFLPLMITTLIGAMENIEDDYYDASLSLGANKIVTFINVILPMSVSGIIVGSVLVFTGSITAYTTPFLLGGNRNMVLATYLQQKSTQANGWGDASVIALIMIVITIIVQMGLQQFAKTMDKRGAH